MFRCEINRFTVSLQTMSIHGMETDNRTRPLLATEAIQSNLPLIQIEFELSPLDKKSDYRLYLVIGALRIEYDAVRNEERRECDLISSF